VTSDTLNTQNHYSLTLTLEGEPMFEFDIAMSLITFAGFYAGSALI